MKKLFLSLLILLFASPCFGYTSRMFISTLKSADIDGETIPYYELNVGATLYRIGVKHVAEPYKTTYNYKQMAQIVECGENGTKKLIYVKLKSNQVSIAEQADEFVAYDYIDLAARAEYNYDLEGDTGYTASQVFKYFFWIRYTVTPVDENDDGKRSGTFKEWEDDTSPGKSAWGRPHVLRTFFDAVR